MAVCDAPKKFKAEMQAYNKAIEQYAKEWLNNYNTDPEFRIKLQEARDALSEEELAERSAYSERIKEAIAIIEERKRKEEYVI